MKLYYSCIHDFQNLEGVKLLTLERQEKIQATKQADDKTRSLLAGLMMRKGLGTKAYTQITKGSHGKPILSDAFQMHFNVSHSGSYVIFAMADSPIGVDIEEIKNPPLYIGKRCFTPEELIWLNSVNPLGTKDADASEFYQLWSGKESVMKAYGLGFQMSPNSFQILPIEDGPHEIKKQTWYLYWSYLERHQICICCATPQDSIELIPWTPQDLL